MISDDLYDDVLVIPLNSKIKQSDFIFNLKKRDKLKKDSVILCNAIKRVNSKRIIKDDGILCVLREEEIKEIEEMVLKVLDID